MMQLNPTVGVAPGTTTMTISDGSGGLGDFCPPDEPWRYTLPPQVQTGLPPGVLAVGPDGKIPLPRYWVGEGASELSGPVTYWNPYAVLPQLRGLGQAGGPRWSLVLFTGLATFAVVFGVRYFWPKK